MKPFEITILYQSSGDSKSEIVYDIEPCRKMNGQIDADVESFDLFARKRFDPHNSKDILRSWTKENKRVAVLNPDCSSAAIGAHNLNAKLKASINTQEPAILVASAIVKRHNIGFNPYALRSNQRVNLETDDEQLTRDVASPTDVNLVDVPANIPIIHSNDSLAQYVQRNNIKARVSAVTHESNTLAPNCIIEGSNIGFSPYTIRTRRQGQMDIVALSEHSLGSKSMAPQWLCKNHRPVFQYCEPMVSLLRSMSSPPM